MLSRYKRVEEAIGIIRAGGMVVVTDHFNRENEGDLIMAGEMVTPEAVNFMAKEGRGLICTPISQSYAIRLGLDPMTTEQDKQGTAFTLSCDLKKGTTTGISASDRALTIKALANPDSIKDDFNRPGHVFPLIAKPKGVLDRPGHTEAAVDLALFAGFTPCGVICEIINDDGTMARGTSLEKFKSKHTLLEISIEELIEYKNFLFNHPPVQIPTELGSFYMETIPNQNSEHMPHLLIYYKPLTKEINLRLHSECMTGDLFGSLRCDCGNQLKKSLEYIKESGGALIYLRQEGRGIGLINKLRAYHLQDLGLDTLDANLKLGFRADERKYDFVATLLKLRGVEAVNLLTNNPLKAKGLRDGGLVVKKIVPMEIKPCGANLKYLKTKKDRMGHILQGV